MDTETLSKWIARIKKEKWAIEEEKTLDEKNSTGFTAYYKNKQLSDGQNYEFHFIQLQKETGEQCRIGGNIETLEIIDPESVANEILNVLSNQQGEFKISLVNGNDFKIDRILPRRTFPT